MAYKAIFVSLHFPFHAGEGYTLCFSCISRGKIQVKEKAEYDILHM